MSKNKDRKAFAILFLLVLSFMYKDSVLDPYFFPEKYRARIENIEEQKKEEEKKKSTEDNWSNPENFKIEEKPVAADQIASDQIKADPVVPDQVPANTNNQAADQPKTSYIQASPSDAEIDQAGYIRVETDRFFILISKLGGRIKSFELKGIRSEINKDSLPYQMVDHVEYAPLPLGVYKDGESDERTLYFSSTEKVIIAREQSTEVVLVGALKNGVKIEKKLIFKGDSPVINLSYSINKSGYDKGGSAEVEWTRVISPKSKSWLDPQLEDGVVWYDGARVERAAYTAIEKDTQLITGVKWIQQGDKYFVETLVSETPNPAKIIKSGQLFRTRLVGGNDSGKFDIFIGPKSIEALTAAGYDLEKSINFGKTGFISAPMTSLLHIFYRYSGNYGLAIILLTLFIKTLTYPLNATSFKSMKALNELAPEMERLKAKFGEDKAGLQMEMMKLYKTKGVNPFGGCLPIFIQIPIFYGLFSALNLSVELRHAEFALWVNDLSSPERLEILGFGIPVLGILFTATMIVQQLITPAPNMDPAQRKIMLFMPVVFGFMFVNFASGLTLYYLTNNLISIAQQQAIKREHPAKAVMITGAASLIIFIIGWLITKL